MTPRAPQVPLESNLLSPKLKYSDWALILINTAYVFTQDLTNVLVLLQLSPIQPVTAARTAQNNRHNKQKQCYAQVSQVLAKSSLPSNDCLLYDRDLYMETARRVFNWCRK